MTQTSIDRGRNTTSSFILPAGRPDDIQMTDLGDAEVIDRLISDFRRAVIGDVADVAKRDMIRDPISAEPNGVLVAGRALRSLVFDPMFHTWEAVGGSLYLRTAYSVGYLLRFCQT